METFARVVSAAVLALALAGCHGNTADLGGGNDEDASMGLDASSHDAGDGSSVMVPNKCHGSGPSLDGSTGPTDAMAQPTSCSSSSDCVAPDVCNLLPGMSTGQCGPGCRSDCDCPAWLTCQGGVCSMCIQEPSPIDASVQNSNCPAGQSCQGVGGGGGPQCSSSSQCGLGGYCYFPPGLDGGYGCSSILVCTECIGGCASCTSNSQCAAGQVCEGGNCQACTASSQCGPHATCAGTHTGTQCACSQDSDCASGEDCRGGVCAASPTGCQSVGPNACAKGQACIRGKCGACTSFEDCQNSLFGPPSPNGGLTCINGICAACTSNGQCGGGQACVEGTCGGCAANSQCGPSGRCYDGFCVCSSDAECASDQRCGAGVCVER